MAHRRAGTGRDGDWDGDRDGDGTEAEAEMETRQERTGRRRDETGRGGHTSVPAVDETRIWERGMTL